LAFRCYLFDLDGTLVDSVRLILDSFRHTARAHFAEAPPESWFLESLGMPLRDIFARLATPDVPVEALVKTYVTFNLERHDDAVRAYDGAAEVLRGIVERGGRVAIVTSKINAHAWRGLQVCGLAEYVELLVGADDVLRAKPDPEPVERALRALEIEAGDAVFIGDSPHDIVAGNAAGVATAAASWGPFPRASLEAARPSFWLERVRDVLAL
jgi:pyrophosphatase PpaX